MLDLSKAYLPLNNLGKIPDFVLLKLYLQILISLWQYKSRACNSCYFIILYNYQAEARLRIFQTINTAET